MTLATRAYYRHLRISKTLLSRSIKLNESDFVPDYQYSLLFFFLNDPAPTEISPLPLPAALPIYFRYEPLKPFPVLRGGPRKAQIIVHHHDLLLSPAESYNPLLECILPSRALLVFDHLPGSRLPNIEVCLAIAVPGGYLGVSFHHTRLPPCAASGARFPPTPA